MGSSFGQKKTPLLLVLISCLGSCAIAEVKIVNYTGPLGVITAVRPDQIHVYCHVGSEDPFDLSLLWSVVNITVESSGDLGVLSGSLKALTRSPPCTVEQLADFSWLPLAPVRRQLSPYGKQCFAIRSCSSWTASYSVSSATAFSWEAVINLAAGLLLIFTTSVVASSTLNMCIHGVALSILFPAVALPAILAYAALGFWPAALLTQWMCAQEWHGAIRWTVVQLLERLSLYDRNYYRAALNGTGATALALLLWQLPAATAGGGAQQQRRRIVRWVGVSLLCASVPTVHRLQVPLPPLAAQLWAQLPATVQLPPALSAVLLPKVLSRPALPTAIPIAIPAVPLAAAAIFLAWISGSGGSGGSGGSSGGYSGGSSSGGAKQWREAPSMGGTGEEEEGEPVVTTAGSLAGTDASGHGLGGADSVSGGGGDRSSSDGGSDSDGDGDSDSGEEHRRRAWLTPAEMAAQSERETARALRKLKAYCGQSTHWALKVRSDTVLRLRSFVQGGDPDSDHLSPPPRSTGAPAMSHRRGGGGGGGGGGDAPPTASLGDDAAFAGMLGSGGGGGRQPAGHGRSRYALVGDASDDEGSCADSGSDGGDGMAEVCPPPVHRNLYAGPSSVDGGGGGGGGMQRVHYHHHAEQYAEQYAAPPQSRQSGLYPRLGHREYSTAPRSFGGSAAAPRRRQPYPYYPPQQHLY